jgi:hypothetical protein
LPGRHFCRTAGCRAPLAFGLGIWLFFGFWFGLQLTDQSLDRGPFPLPGVAP